MNMRLIRYFKRIFMYYFDVKQDLGRNEWPVYL
jgi:hypothetical protein